MNFRTLTVLGLAAGWIAAGPAFADHGRDYRNYVGPRHGTYARVVAVEPIVRLVAVQRPRRECWEETVYRPAQPGRVAASTLAGGVIGGTLGQAIGENLHDRGARAALGFLGAAAGSAIAADRARRRTGDIAVPVERCAVTYDRVTEEQVSGYWVTYRYRGRLHRIHTFERPGDRVLIAHGPRRY